MLPVNDEQQQAQLPDQQQQDQAQAPAPSPSPEAGPPVQDPAVEKVLMLVDTMEPGDSQHLANLINSHPGMREQILAKAAEALGNETVAKALEILTGKPVATEPVPEQAPEAPPVPQLTQQQQSILFNLMILEPGDTKLLAKILGEHPEMYDAIVAEATKYMGENAVQQAIGLLRGAAPPDAAAEPTPAAAVVENAQANVAEEPKPVEEEAGWVVRARAFNEQHHDHVVEFNQLTAGACIIDGRLDPNLVATWQQDHGVSPDGRVGADTVAAARGTNPEPAAAPQVAEPAAEPPPPVA